MTLLNELNGSLQLESGPVPQRAIQDIKLPQVRSTSTFAGPSTLIDTPSSISSVRRLGRSFNLCFGLDVGTAVG